MPAEAACLGFLCVTRPHPGMHRSPQSWLRAALVSALASSLKALDACAVPFLVATTHRAAVAVAPVSAIPDASSGAVKGGAA
eukprot:312814-Pleurochrysis_carterae.AAC.1